ncbi:class II aldolase/adducin family protein [Micromonospora endophytica]|uniref:Class II aldolase/adducin family protein n=1 Tax=Micromonospora endophytica TaxID=515350 RepID=A0A2W2DPW6_9ACTN|nr:class II aldolase/adducin family protein [Micromonospora endophytica]PZF99196.1 class II aldolase/adducin family protein [Micromonospora endophytica]RIW45075.1 class II aldolase/adducin family protein [Micromonospora endophytica]BCJ58048.1 class II aldolase/adducin family protein [Micromonospora endophytica]
MTVIDHRRPGYLADTHTGLPIPTEPVFTSAEDERRHRKQRLAAALRIFGKLGYGEGISGHISVRDPENLDQFWVNPFGVSFNRVTVRDLICVDDQGRVVAGRHPVNPSAFAIHSQIHQLRPDATAAAHGHTAHSRALGALGRLLEPIDQESAAFYRNQVLFDRYDGPSVAVEQGRAMAEALGDRRAILLRHHGLITVGGSVDEAVHWFVTYDGCAQVQLLAAAAGQLGRFTDEQAEAARDGFGDAQLGWFSFQVLWDDIVHEQPDLLDE